MPYYKALSFKKYFKNLLRQYKNHKLNELSQSEHLYNHYPGQEIEHYLNPQIPLCPFSISKSPLLLKDNQYSDFYHYKLVVSVFELYMSGITMVSSFPMLKRTFYIIHIYADMKILVHVFWCMYTYIYFFTKEQNYWVKGMDLFSLSR